MLSIAKDAKDVKNASGTFAPGGENRATLESDLSAPSGPFGASVPTLVNSPSETPPNGLKTINSPGPESEDSYFTCFHRHMSASDTRTRVARAFVAAGKDSKADSFLRCGEQVYTLECEQCGHRQKVAYNCKLRVCSRCGWAKTAALMKKYLPYVKSLAATPKYLRRMDLTLKNVDDLGEGVKEIRECFTRLRHKKDYVFDFDGGIYGIEAVPGKDGKWNIHMHVLYAGQFIRQERLSADWWALTGDSMVIWVRLVRDPEKSLRYVLKYIAKGVENPEDLTEEQLAEFVLVLENIRLIQAFGCFMGNMARKQPFRCPKCGSIFWRLLGPDGEVSYSALADLVRDYRKARKMPFLFPLTKVA